MDFDLRAFKMFDLKTAKNYGLKKLCLSPLKMITWKKIKIARKIVDLASELIS